MKTLSELIEINTINPPGNEMRIIEYIQNRIPYCNYIVDRISENRGNLIYEIKGRENSTIAIIGHMDTVPISDETLWKTPPLEMKRINDEVFGRGVSDMKSGIAIMIMLTELFINQKPKYNIKFIYTCDEESLGKGIRSIVKQNFLDDVDMVLIPEPTENKLGLKEKGAIWIEGYGKGRSAHGCNISEGINAIEIALEFKEKVCLEIERLDYSELLGRNTVSINKLKSGTKTNIVPDNAQFELDIRYNVSSKKEDILKVLDKVKLSMKKKYDQEVIEYSVIDNKNSLISIINHDLIQEMIHNLPKEEVGVKYFTDMAVISEKYDLPFLIFGPGYPEECHVIDEKASVSKIIEGYHYYKRILK